MTFKEYNIKDFAVMSIYTSDNMLLSYWYNMIKNVLQDISNNFYEISIWCCITSKDNYQTYPDHNIFWKCCLNI